MYVCMYVYIYIYIYIYVTSAAAKLRPVRGSGLSFRPRPPPLTKAENKRETCDGTFGSKSPWCGRGQKAIPQRSCHMLPKQPLSFCVLRACKRSQKQPPIYVRGRFMMFERRFTQLESTRSESLGREVPGHSLRLRKFRTSKQERAHVETPDVRVLASRIDKHLYSLLFFFIFFFLFVFFKT